MPEDHKPLPVAGYSSQSSDNVEIVNYNKCLEELILRRIDRLKENKDFDPRWLSIAVTHIEQGFMAMNRAIFKPKRLEGDIVDHTKQKW